MMLIIGTLLPESTKRETILLHRAICYLLLHALFVLFTKQVTTQYMKESF